jgi:hypothetical protein
VWAKERVTWHNRDYQPLQRNEQLDNAAAAAQAAAQAVAAPGEQPAGNAVAGSQVRHERTVHLLHFLVDGVDGSLWDNGLQVDAAPAPARVAPLPLLRLELTWAALQGLYGPKQQQDQGHQQQADGDRAEQGSAFNVGDAMSEVVAALGW